VNRTTLREIYLSVPCLEGELDLEDFTYQDEIGNGIEVYVSSHIEESKLEIKNLPSWAKIIRLVSAQN